MKAIYEDTHDIIDGPRWRVEEDPMMSGRTELVRFIKWGQHRKLLDRIACWDGRRWCPLYWVPRHPLVPQSVLAQVVAHMRGAR